MNRFHRIIRICTIGLSVTGAHGHAAENGQTSGSPGRVDRAYSFVNRSLVDSVQRVDDLFDDQTSQADDVSTRVKLRERLLLSRKDGSDDNLSVSARLNLPKISRRLSLVVAGDDDVDTLLDDADGEEDAGLQDAGDEPSLGLRYAAPTGNERLRLSFTAGLRSAPEVYVGARVRYQRALGEHWLWRFNEDLRWYSEDGRDSRTRFELDRLVDGVGLMRHSLDLRWREARRDEVGLLTTVRGFITRGVGNGAALRYGWKAEYHSQPESEWQTVTLSLTYRRQWLREWLFVEVSPELGFQREHNWSANPALRVGLELIFDDQFR